jgi:hypothetical protein
MFSHEWPVDRELVEAVRRRCPDALVVVGGEGNANDARGVFDVVEAYDGVAGAWRSAPPLPRGIHGTGAAAVGPWLLVPGGADAQAFAAVETCAMFGP